MLNVFVSFAEGDEPLVARLRQDAAARGEIKLYRYDEDTQPGASIADKVKAAISKSDVVVVLLTQRGAGSMWIGQEVGAAHALGKRIIPIHELGAPVPGLLDGLERVTLDPSDVPTSLGRAADFLKKQLTKKDNAQVLALMGLFLLFLGVASK